MLGKFDRDIPTTAKYSWLKNGYLDAKNITSRHVAKYNRQDHWDKAWEWYDAYKSGAIPFLEYRIKIREKELEKHEGNLRFHKAQIEKFGKNRKQIKLIKSYKKIFLNKN